MMILIFDSSRPLADRLAEIIKDKIDESTVYKAATYKEAEQL
jgi:hypothetical protein